LAKGANSEALINLISKCWDADKTDRIDAINELIDSDFLVAHYEHSLTEKMVLCEYEELEYEHELETSIKLTGFDYHVLFAPKSLFKPQEKKFDIFLIKNNIIFKADLKYIRSSNIDTISKRIKDGSLQCDRLVLDIKSNISSNDLIEALKSGCHRNNYLKEIMLLYKNKFYRLQKTQILSKGIFKVIK
jgi:hypothetical protein